MKHTPQASRVAAVSDGEKATCKECLQLHPWWLFPPTGGGRISDMRHVKLQLQANLAKSIANANSKSNLILTQNLTKGSFWFLIILWYYLTKLKVTKSNRCWVDITHNKVNFEIMIILTQIYFVYIVARLGWLPWALSDASVFSFAWFNYLPFSYAKMVHISTMAIFLIPYQIPEAFHVIIDLMW